MERREEGACRMEAWGEGGGKGVYMAGGGKREKRETSGGKKKNLYFSLFCSFFSLHCPIAPCFLVSREGRDERA